jgi:hypothetical protein
VDGHAELLAPGAQDRQQSLAADRGESVPTRSQNLPVVVDVDVIPNRKVLRQALKESCICLFDAAERLV